ncbi:T9SS type A sorting domain-containing protein [Taibaiella koreensis]|uniref:T9SS type A sorting domain-containing protein n=1 Tax=Taibaiella koreensis TaxID=1268548 RepID=UPI000E59F050|nr:T9SS type A sorting domain-containing protein [Taibaiella koreensis]
MKKTLSILALFALLIAQQAYAQTTMTRLIARASDTYRSLGFEYLDSSSLSYTGTRGGKIDVFAGIPALPVPKISFDIKTDFLYDASAGIWNNRNKYLHTFDANDNILTEVHQNWNTAAGTWENYSKRSFTYTTENRLATYVNQLWNTTSGNWDNVAKSVYTYDINGNMTSEIRSVWNTSGGVWNLLSNSIYTYNSNNLRDDFLSQTWNTGSNTWVNSLHWIYSYTGTNLDFSILQLWNTGAGIWDNYEKDIYTYTVTHKISIDDRQKWIAGSWTNDRRYLYIYTPGDDLDNVTGEDWDAGFSTWISKSRDLSTWDANHNKIANVNQQLNTSTLLMENRYQTLYTYTAGNDVVFMETKGWDAATATWQYNTSSSGRSRFYYETYSTTGIAPVANTVNCVLYPVPASDVLHISVQWEVAKPVEVAICDMYGHIIQRWTDKSVTAAYNRTLPVQHLAAGNYMIKLSSGNQTANKVFTVTR